ncbi:MAG: hypothetical protein MK074_02395 [Phycisphaerales bacterium]|nr:hypothetical protein [Phycisphaerales bacterium]
MIYVCQFATVAATAASAQSAESAMLWGLLLIGAAIIVLALELLLPSGGLLALVAGFLLVGSLVAFFQHSPGAGWLALTLMIVLGPICCWYGFKIWSKSPLADKMILTDEGPTTPHEQSLEGAVGVAETPLRPIGTVRVNDQRRDALSELGVIEAGTHIVVVEDHDNQLKVRAAQPHEKEQS